MVTMRATKGRPPSVKATSRRWFAGAGGTGGRVGVVTAGTVVVVVSPGSPGSTGSPGGSTGSPEGRTAVESPGRPEENSRAALHSPPEPYIPLKSGGRGMNISYGYS